jgi:hypothetical protein
MIQDLRLTIPHRMIERVERTVDFSDLSGEALRLPAPMYDWCVGNGEAVSLESDISLGTRTLVFADDAHAVDFWLRFGEDFEVARQAQAAADAREEALMQSLGNIYSGLTAAPVFAIDPSAMHRPGIIPRLIRLALGLITRRVFGVASHPEKDDLSFTAC